MTSLLARIFRPRARCRASDFTVYTRASVLLPQGTRPAQGVSAAPRFSDRRGGYRRRSRAGGEVRHEVPVVAVNGKVGSGEW